MKKKLQEAQEKLKNRTKQLTTRDKSAAKDSETKETPQESVDIERETILSKGRRYVRPLGLSPQKALRMTGIIIAGLILGIVLLLSVLIYYFESDSDVVYGASRVLPFPAECIDGRFGCVVGGSMVRYSDYQFNLRTLKNGSSSQLGADNEIDFTTEEGQQQLETFKTLALLEARQNVVLRQIARERGVSVERSEVDEEIDRFVESEGGEEQLETAIESIYGWSLNDFRRVVELQILRTKVQRLEAEEVLALVEDGGDFAELAQEYSSDGSAEGGGDLGFVDEDTPFVEEFKEAALALEVGETTGLVETQFGFHIITATDRDEDEGVRVSHILIDGASLQEELQQRLEEAEIRTYIDVNTDLGGTELTLR